MLTPDRIRAYYEARLQGQRFTSRGEVKLRCPFHDDKIPSLSVNLEKGGWKCFAGCGSGGVLDFEMKFSRCDQDTARANVAQLLGEKQMSYITSKPEATYQYLDEAGRLVFEKLRYPGKRFVLRRPDGKDGYIYRLDEGLKPLYRLPEVLVANYVFICEGEKDADNVRALNLGNREKNWFVAATTNFDGAGKWRDEYPVYFAGKSVVIFPDNDEPGRKHADQVAASVYRYTHRVKVVALPGLPDKGDVSDYLKTHSPQDLIQQINATPGWVLSSTSGGPRILVPVPGFASSAREEIDWMVEGIIERGANGAIVAEPKVGKSWAAIDLALSLALGVGFLGFRIPRPVKVAFVSREDNPSLTAWRIRHLFASKRSDNPNLLETNLWINTRQQSKQLLLDNAEQCTELIADLRLVKPEFLILDVLNTLHTRDENDNTEMRQVLSRLDEIQREVGCGIGMVHHYNKTGSGSMTQRMRGSSAIAGWCEWMIGIEIADAQRKLRKMQFELKAAQPPDPVYWAINSGQGAATLKCIELPEEDVCGRVQ
jgi:putative DNA primase/helicase